MIDIFTQVVPLLLVLYGVIVVGYFLGRYGTNNAKDLSYILYTFIAPALAFYAMSHVELSVGALAISLITLIVHILIHYVVFTLLRGYLIYGKIWIITLSSASAGVGYIGLPIAMYIFDTNTAYLYMLALLGKVIYEQSFSNMIFRQDNFSLQEGLLGIIKSPVSYALLLGVVFSLIGFEVNLKEIPYLYVLLGLLIFGMVLSDTKFMLDIEYIVIPIFVKFILVPILIFGLVGLDRAFFHFMSVEIYSVLLLWSIMPIVTNSETFPSIFILAKNKITLTSFLSYLLALIYIPFMIWFLEIL